MAAFSVNAVVVDGKGKKSTVTINIPDTIDDLGPMLEFAGNAAVLVDALISGQIISIGVCLNVALPGALKDSPGASSDVEEGARFIFRTAGNYLTRVRLPTFLESKMTSGSNLVNQADGDVSDFVDMMIDGQVIDLISIFPCDYRSDDIVGLDSALDAFTKSRR